MSKKKIVIPEWFTAGIAFVYYWIMSLYKLLDAPIWQDEAMEFYCSMTQKGAIRGITAYETMYERMAYIQQQPPLYNWLMALWLKVSEGEWWYRFSSVLAGFVAVVTIYFLLRKLCNRLTATVSVFVFSSIYIVQYYIKEASEYMMLIAFILFTVCLFFSIMEQATAKKTIGFVIVCVLDMLTHYGAVFVVVPMALTILIYYGKQKEWKLFRTAAISYVAAGVGVGLPLLIFFVAPQSTNAVSTLGVDKPYEITGNNIILDFFDSLMWVLRWCMLDYDRDAEKITWAIWIVLFALIALGIFVWKKTKKKQLRWYMGANIGVFFFYYVVTTLNIYAYGWFGNRYNLFILPLWFVWIALILHETVVICKESDNVLLQKAESCVRIGILLAMFLFCLYGDKRIHNHWAKMDLRTVVAEWYAEDGEEIPTFVNFHQRYAFVYYMTHDEQYQESDWDYLHCSQNLESLSYSDEQWIAYLEKEIYPDGIPEKMYVVSGQNDTIVWALESIGYETTAVVDTTAKLFLMEKK